MADVNRREFIGAAAVAPMIGDIIEPISIQIMTVDGKVLNHSEAQDSYSAIISLYGRMLITGKTLATVKDDAAWRKLIHDKCVNLEESLYAYVKQYASRVPEPEHLMADTDELRKNFSSMIKDANGNYVHQA